MDQPFTERRLRFMDAIGEGLAVVPGAQEIMRNADTNHDFRQASDFFFLTGFDEPDAVAVFNPTHVKERYVLFVRPRGREMEIWNRSEEHTSELQSRPHLVCRLLLEKKKKT